MDRRTMLTSIGAQRRHLSRLALSLLTAIAVALGTVLIAPTAAATPVRVPVKAPAMAAQQVAFDALMISYVNEARVENGLWPLTEAKGLTQLSTWWSDQMLSGVTGGKLQHYANAWTDVKNYGASNRLAWGENVAKLPSSATARQLFNAYMNSPGHRANILSTKYHFIGMGTVSDGLISFNAMEFTDQVDSTTKINVKGVWKTATSKVVKKTIKQAKKGKTTAKKAPAKKAAKKSTAKKK